MTLDSYSDEAHGYYYKFYRKHYYIFWNYLCDMYVYTVKVWLWICTVMKPSVVCVTSKFNGHAIYWYAEDTKVLNTEVWLWICIWFYSDEAQCCYKLKG